MEPVVRLFVRSSMAWLALGLGLGLAMVWGPGSALMLRPAHTHVQLLGFVSMMIFGVGYHVFPRFAGRPLRSRRMAWIHLISGNAGLALLAAGWLVPVIRPGGGGVLLRAGSLLAAAGAALFIVNIWQTVGPGPSGVTHMGIRSRLQE
jgi:hypothetical protein